MRKSEISTANMLLLKLQRADSAETVLAALQSIYTFFADGQKCISVAIRQQLIGEAETIHGKHPERWTKATGAMYGKIMQLPVLEEQSSLAIATDSIDVPPWSCSVCASENIGNAKAEQRQLIEKHHVVCIASAWGKRRQNIRTFQK